ncbi:hypothetical protein NNM06_14330 [Enterococcus faecium]|nr:hypothetical protein [Enterococcus faecium]
MKLDFQQAIQDELSDTKDEIREVTKQAREETKEYKEILESKIKDHNKVVDKSNTALKSDDKRRYKYIFCANYFCTCNACDRSDRSFLWY